MIMSFCKKGLHSFLGFTSFVDSPPPSSLQSSPSKASASSVGLSTATGEFPRGPNVVESTAVSSPPPPVARKDSGGVFGFVDEIGGGGVVVDGLMSCTESLGFESSDDLWADEWLPAGPSVTVERTVSRREESERRRETAFPPPISSLNRNGQRSFFLRPMRTDGRLELTEVRIDRPEILRASREDGRLRLELIIDEEVEVEEQEQEMIEQEQVMIQEEQEMIEEEEEEATIEESHEEMQEDQEFVVERFQEQQQPGVGEWKIPVSGDGFGRCHEIASHHHPHSHHHHNLWQQPCVPIR